MESARDPEGTIEVLAKKDPLTDKAVERERLQLSLDWSVATPWVVEHGMSDVDPERLADTTAAPPGPWASRCRTRTRFIPTPTCRPATP